MHIFESQNYKELNQNLSLFGWRVMERNRILGPMVVISHVLKTGPTGRTGLTGTGHSTRLFKLKNRLLMNR